MAILILTPILIISCLLLYDGVGIENKQGTGVVIDKYFVPERTYTTTMMICKGIFVPQTHYVPCAWHVIIQVKGFDDNIQIGETAYNSMAINQKVNLIYTISRISNSIRIKNIEWDE